MAQADIGAADVQGEPVRALAARYYTDQAIFEAEKERIFFRTWQFACHASKLRKPGDYTVFELFDQSLLLLCGADEEIRAFYNVCQHRAHELLSGEGNVRNIVCPYHALTYGIDGRLKRARNSAKVVDFDVSAICLSQVRVENFCGFLFVNLDPDAAPMCPISTASRR